MEESMISTTNYVMSKVVCSSSDGTNYSSSSSDREEESSWTFYLDDFKASSSSYPCASNEHEDDSLLISGCGTSSMASEAACSAHKKQRFDREEDREGPARRICAKRRKNRRAVFVDHDLEDTATSPDHTPKGNDFNQLLMDNKEMMGSKGIFKEHILFQTLNKLPDDGVCIGTSQGKGNTSDQNTKEIEFVGKEISYYTELRRKGLCLVPISMIFNSCVS